MELGGTAPITVGAAAGGLSRNAWIFVMWLLDLWFKTVLLVSLLVSSHLPPYNWWINNQ